MSTYKLKLKKTGDKTTILRSKCIDCNNCPIEYNISSRRRELCMCSCHSHAAPSQAKEERREEVIGLGKLG